MSKKIESINDFEDERSIELAEKYNMNPKEIAPEYNELKKQDKIDIDRNNIEEVSKYIKRFACGAVICYELAKSKKIIFPSDSKKKPVFKRILSALEYELFGDVYSGTIDRLEETYHC